QGAALAELSGCAEADQLAYLARRLSDPRNAAGGTGLERAHVSALARAVLNPSMKPETELWALTRHTRKGDGMHIDALSDVLKTIRMTGAVFFRVSARAPWVAQQLPREAVLPMILPGAEHMISSHIVTEGQCFANVIGGESIALTAGQVIVFTRGDRHVM